MDIEQFLADAPLASLLGLMAIPLLAAAVLVAFLVVSFARRGKKSKMKHGIQSASSPSTEDELDANSDTPDDDPPPEVVNKSTSPSISNSLDLGVFSKKVDGEANMDDSQKPSADENIDLAARLNMQSATDETASKSANPVPSRHPVELLRLLRDPQSGQLILEVGGEQIGYRASFLISFPFWQS